MRVDANAQAAARQVISEAARATGVDFSLLLATAQRESGLNRNAHASTSSAAGLFQFVDSTWMNLVARYGAKHGLHVDASDPSQRQQILDLRYDPRTAALMAGELAHENAAALHAKLGRPATDNELYAAHVLGPGKAAMLIKAAQTGQANAAALDPRAAAANHRIFFGADGSARSAGEVLAELGLAPRAASAPAPAVTPPAPETVSTLTETPALGLAATDLWSLALRAYLRGEFE